MERGIVKWFDQQKGYGFITADSGGKDFFVHYSDIETLDKILEKGERVEFEIGTGPKGAQAKMVKPLEQI